MIVHAIKSARMSEIVRELTSQPDTWRRAAAEAPGVAAILPRSGDRVAAVGCGTSLFVSQAYAGAPRGAGEGETDAFAASEAPAGRIYDVVMAISRSGTTTEVARLLERPWEGARSVAICGVDDTPVANAADDRDHPRLRRRTLGRPDAVRDRRARAAPGRTGRGPRADRRRRRASARRRPAARRPRVRPLRVPGSRMDRRAWRTRPRSRCARRAARGPSRIRPWSTATAPSAWRDRGPPSGRSATSSPTSCSDVAATGATIVDHGLGRHRSDGRAHPGAADGGGARRGARDGSGSSAAPDPFGGALVNVEDRRGSHEAQLASDRGRARVRARRGGVHQRRRRTIGNNGNSTGSSGPIKLTMWVGYTPPPPENQSFEYLSIDRMVKEFEADNPDITIELPVREQRQRAAEGDGRDPGEQAARHLLPVRHEHGAARAEPEDRRPDRAA